MSAPLGDEAEALALWVEALRRARTLCRRTLARLRRGEGGFYDVEDLEQDLFIEFWGVLRWWREEGGGDETLLWRAWAARLWGGGRRLLRRAPQRLWRGAERSLPPQSLALEAGIEGDREAQLAARETEALVQPEDGWQTQARLERVAALEGALARLRPAQRQVVYMAQVQELSGGEVAQRMALPSAASAYQRLCRARRLLRELLRRGEGYGEGVER